MEQMQKTGILSIDKFFNYGENTLHRKVSFTPMVPTVLQMFTSQYTSSLHDRKASAVRKLASTRSSGFFYEQIQGLTQLIHLLRADLFASAGESEVQREMQGALEAVLLVDSGQHTHMFNKNMGSDQLRYLRFIPPLLDSLEPLLRYPQTVPRSASLDALRVSVLQYLQRLASKQIAEILSKEESFENQKSDEQSPLQQLQQQGTKHLRAICQSKVLEALMELFFDYTSQKEIVEAMFELLSSMTMYGKLAEELAQRGAVPLVLEIMLLCEDFRAPLVKTGFQILWSVVEGVGVDALAPLVTQEHIHALHSLFVRVVKEGYKLQDKCLRNEIVILVNYLLSLPDAVPYFLSSGFLQVLLRYSIVDEAKFCECKSRVADSKVEFGTNAEDLELKKLLWSGLLSAVESGHSEVVQLAQEHAFLKYLLMYIDSGNASYAVTRWSSPQLRELQQHVLSILTNAVLYMRDDFEEKKGIFSLTKFLSNVNDVERREKCLKTFVNASLFEEAYKIKITEEGILDYLLEFLQGEENPVEIRELCLTIIANLCKDCKKNKKLFREKHGVDILITYLKDPNIATSNRYVLLGLALLNCLWNAVLGSRRSEQRFLNSQGLFNLLEFIEMCEYSHRKMAFSCLSYLTENSKAVAEFLEWNSEKTMVNATQLMVRIYAEEDEKYAVKYNNGVVVNRHTPLVPMKQKKHSAPTAYLKDLSETGTETYLVNRIKEEVEQYDLRLIVFSVLYRVGFSKNDLSAGEQQKIEVIQMYPHFKMGEIWSEIKEQLKAEHVHPTVDDSHWMDTSLEEFEEQMDNCINTQHLILREYNKTQEKDLTQFYQVIKHNKPIK